MRTPRRLLAALPLLALALAAPALADDAAPRVRYDGFKVIRVQITDLSQLGMLERIGARLWSEEAGVGAVEYLVPPGSLAALAATRLPQETVFENVQKMIDDERARLESAPDTGADGVNYFADYRDYATTNAYIDTLIALNPAIASRVSAGLSLQGRDQFGIHITGPGNPALKPGFHIEAVQHAREWATLPCAMWAADQLIRQYGVDPTITNFVNSIDFYIFPIFNPDGYVYTWGPDRLWRKNRRPNVGGSFGVDPNRNWSYQWGGTGSSASPSAEDYRGTGPFSEPETLNMSNFIAAHPNIRGLVDFHSNGQVCIFPWGFTNDPCPAHAEFNTIGTSLAAAIQSVNGIYADPGSSGAVLYLAAGNVRDWAYAARNIRPVTLEVRAGSNGFTPPASAIAPTDAENWAGVKVFAQWIATNNPVRFARNSAEVFSVNRATPTPVSIDNSVIAGPNAGLAQPTTLWTRVGAAGPFTPQSMTPGAADAFSGTLPGAGCAAAGVDYYFEGQANTGETATFPAAGAAGPLHAPVGTRTVVFSDAFETSLGWVVGGAGTGDTATAGLWTRVNPISNAAQPEDDNPFGVGTFCYITANGAVQGQLDADVDNGGTSVTSPAIDGTGAGTLYVSYYRWFSNNTGNNRDQPTDNFTAMISNNNGASWVNLEQTAENTGKWTPREFKVSDFVPITNQMKIRFTTRDSTPDSTVEGGVDDVVFFRLVCDSIPGDVNGDGFVNFADLNLVLSNFGQAFPGIPGDADGDGDVDFADLNIVLSNFGTGG